MPRKKTCKSTSDWTKSFTDSKWISIFTSMANPEMMGTFMKTMIYPAFLESMMKIMDPKMLESMDFRANANNMKQVGHNTPWKLIESITGKASPRLEIVSFCDVLTMRAILDYVPEFGVFVPCRISVLEDAKKNIWLISMDWDVCWLDTSPNPNRISPELNEKAIKIREMIEEFMKTGANWDL